MTRKARILIADDDESLLAALKIRFEQLNAEIVTATDGYTALARAQETTPDLLILDINMPAGDGFSVHERLAAVPGFENIPVIYLTGDRSERLDNLAFQLGAFEVYHKPVDMKYLAASVYDALRPKAA
ncbi:MAG: response regulator [Phycisphaerales bacterium JB063]